MKAAVIFFIFYAHFCFGNNMWYQTEISLHLVPPFNSVYTIFQQNILNEVLKLDSNLLAINESAFSAFSTSIHLEASNLLKYLNLSVMASNNIRIKVDQKLMTIINEIAAKENEIELIGQQIQDMADNIEVKHAQISSAEESVKQAELSVISADNALLLAEKEVEDAKLCAGLLGKRKRALNTMFNLFFKPMELAVNTGINMMGSSMGAAGNVMVNGIVKPVCSVINYQKIDNAKKNVETTKNTLSALKYRIQTLTNDLNSMQTDLNTYNAQLFDLSNMLNELKDSVIDLPSEQHVILSIHEKLTNVISQLFGVMAGSASFLDAMMKMIDFESIVKPLNDIYDDLLDNHLIISLDHGKIRIEQINQAKSILESVVAMLLNMPFKMAK